MDTVDYLLCLEDTHAAQAAAEAAAEAEAAAPPAAAQRRTWEVSRGGSQLFGRAGGVLGRTGGRRVPAEEAAAEAEAAAPPAAAQRRTWEVSRGGSRLFGRDGVALYGEEGSSVESSVESVELEVLDEEEETLVDGVSGGSETENVMNENKGTTTASAAAAAAAANPAANPATRTASATRSANSRFRAAARMIPRTSSVVPNQSPRRLTRHFSSTDVVGEWKKRTALAPIGRTRSNVEVAQLWRTRSRARSEAATATAAAKTAANPAARTTSAPTTRSANSRFRAAARMISQPSSVVPNPPPTSKRRLTRHFSSADVVGEWRRRTAAVPIGRSRSNATVISRQIVASQVPAQVSVSRNRSRNRSRSRSRIARESTPPVDSRQERATIAGGDRVAPQPRIRRLPNVTQTDLEDTHIDLGQSSKKTTTQKVAEAVTQKRRALFGKKKKKEMSFRSQVIKYNQRRRKG